MLDSQYNICSNTALACYPLAIPLWLLKVPIKVYMTRDTNYISHRIKNQKNNFHHYRRPAFFLFRFILVSG